MNVFTNNSVFIDNENVFTVQVVISYRYILA